MDFEREKALNLLVMFYFHVLCDVTRVLMRLVEKLNKVKIKIMLKYVINIL